MNQLNNATIEIVEMSDKAGKFGPIKKIKGKNIETGQTNTYTVYKSKQDGTDSAAWGQLSSINVLDTVNVGYVEQSGTMQDGKPFTSRIVRNFDKDLGNGRKNYTQHNPAPQAEKPGQGQNLKPSEDVDWDEIAVGKCQTAFLAAFLQAGNTFADAKLQVTQARKLAELVVYGQQLTQRDPIPEPEEGPGFGDEEWKDER